MVSRKPRTLRRALRGGLAATALAGASLLAPASARADGNGIVFRLPGLGVTSYRFTNTTILGFRTSNFDTNPHDDNFFNLTERFDSAFAAPPWRLQIRLDAFGYVMWPGNAPVPAGFCEGNPAQCYLRNDIRPERIALRYQRGAITLEGGDVYFVLGRGVAMSFRKVDPLGLDTAIRGGRFELDLGRFMLRGFGGIANPQNLDPLTLAVQQDTQTPGRYTFFNNASQPELRPGYDALGGAEATVRLGEDEDIEFAVHALHVHFPESVVRAYDVDVFGYRFQLPSLFNGAMTFHAEVNALRRTTTQYRLGEDPGTAGPLQSQRDRFGRGIYLGSQLTLGNTNAILEWKDYTNYILSPDGSANDPRRIYSAAPALEREDVQFRSNYNTRGGRLRVEHAFRPGPWSASATVAASGFAEETDRDPWGADSFGVVHGHLLLRRRRSGLGVRAGGSGDGAGGSGTDTGGGGGSGMVGSAATGGLGGGGGRVAVGDWQFQATLGYRHEFLLGPRRMRQAGAPDWQVVHGDIDISFALTQNQSLEFRLDARYERRYDDNLNYYEFTRDGLTATWSYTDRLTVSGIVRVDNRLLSMGRQNLPLLFPAAEARYRFSGGSTFRIFGGMTPGGLLCSGGVCREVPPFQGVLGELILRI